MFVRLRCGSCVLKTEFFFDRNFPVVFLLRLVNCKRFKEKSDALFVKIFLSSIFSFCQ